MYTVQVHRALFKVYSIVNVSEKYSDSELLKREKVSFYLYLVVLSCCKATVKQNYWQESYSYKETIILKGEPCQKVFTFKERGERERQKMVVGLQKKRQKRDKQIINIKKIIRKKYEIRSNRGIIGIYLESITI